MGRLSRFLRRPIDEKWLLFRAFLLLTIVRVGLWTLPYRTVSRWTHRAVERSRRRSSGSAFTVATICSAISAAARLVPGASCLTQALVGQIFLARSGHAATLKLGVMRKEDARLHAHAWLEHGGRIVLGDGTDLPLMQPLRGSTAAVHPN